MNQSLTESATIDAQEIVRYSKLLRRGGFLLQSFYFHYNLEYLNKLCYLSIKFRDKFRLWNLLCENAMNESFIYKFHLIQSYTIINISRQMPSLFKLLIVLSKLQCDLSESITINIFNVKNKIFLDKYVV